MSEPATLPAVERRRTPRHRVFKGARLIGNGLTFECIVRNISDHGAGVDIDGSLPLPQSVTLVFDQDRSVRHAQLRWRSAGRAGIGFD